MRVFELNTFCGTGSTGRIAGEIARLVEDDGGACEIGYGAGSPSPDTERFAYRIGTPVERKLHGAARKLLDAEGYGSVLGTRALICEMERFHPDVVQLHNIHGCYLNHSLLFSYLQKSGVPVVWTLHDCWPFTGHCAYFDFCGCDKWKTGCERCPQLKSYPVCYGLDGSRRNYAHKKKLFAGLDKLTFVTPCEWMKQPLSQSFLKDKPARVIYNGVDLSTFQPTQSDIRERYGIGGKKLVLAVASEWDERKGLRYLLEAAGALDKTHRFAVIGLGDAQLAELPQGIIGLARTESVRELAAWYTAADCLCNPTMEDNMPMVNLEALACGTPVVTFLTGGCPEAIDEGCGIAVPKGDTSALRDAILAMTSAQQKPIDACLARARRFDGKQTFRAYLELYKELCR